MNVKLKGKKKLVVNSAADIFAIMQPLLMRENRIDRNREHFWTISLDSASKILNIELVSFGSVNQTVVEPMEVFSVPLQKRAVTIILIHNHPSGKLIPSPKDKDITDRLIQCGFMMHVPVLDHLIITETAYYSFEETGLLAELSLDSKYELDFDLKKRTDRKVADIKKENKLEIAKIMIAKGYDVKEIIELTGLSKLQVNRIKM